jgi:hypothetical protein
MFLRGMLSVALAVCCAVSASAQKQPVEQIKPEEIEQFVKLALLQGSANFALSEYTHLQKVKVTELDKKGQLKEKLSTVRETFVPSRLQKGQRVRWVYVLIEKNGKPVSASDIEKERLKAGERLVKEEAEIHKSPPSAEEIARQAELPKPRGIYFSLGTGGLFSGNTTFSVRGILATAIFTNPRYETVNGRQMVALDFTSKPDVKWDDGESFQARLTGRAWFDLEEIMLAKLEGWPVGQTRPETPHVIYESLRTADGQWLPRLIAINGDQRKAFFQRDLNNITVEFTDYQRFGSEVKEVQMKEPAKP